MATNYGTPFKTLEITVASAHDLAPVSKMLRTFAVAWIHPDQKLSTKIDYHGHNNPVWHYKLVFRVDDKFLNNEMAAITFEIYNVAWLRDLPIGTAYLFINHISPPIVQNSPVTRPVVLYIRRPTGHLQGILHVGVSVSLISNNVSVSGSPLRGELSAFSYENQDDRDHENSKKDEGEEDEKKNANAIGVKRQLSIPRDGLLSYVDENDDVLNVKEGKDAKKLPKTIMKTKSFSSTNISMVTIMHPLPSEVAYHLKKGFYAPEGEEEYGSSVFENWSDPSEANAEPWQIDCGAETNPGARKWKTEDKVPLKLGNGLIERKVREGYRSSPRHKRSKSSGGGLFSCFGKGFEFTFAYGTKTAKNRNKFQHISHYDGKIIHKLNTFS